MNIVQLVEDILALAKSPEGLAVLADIEALIAKFKGAAK
jgi:hypothetical protein